MKYRSSSFRRLYADLKGVRRRPHRKLLIEILSMHFTLCVLPKKWSFNMQLKVLPSELSYVYFNLRILIQRERGGGDGTLPWSHNRCRPARYIKTAAASPLTILLPTLEKQELISKAVTYNQLIVCLFAFLYTLPSIKHTGN